MRKSIAAIHILALLCFVIWVTGCSYYTAEANIQPEELYGVWSFNEFTLGHSDRLKEIGLTKLSVEDNTIEIEKDGSCHFNTYTAFHPFGYHLISDGTWELKKGYDNGLAAETWYVEFDLTPHAHTIVRTRFFLKKSGDRLIMYDFIDDPDQNQFVEFERKPVERSTE